MGSARFWWVLLGSGGFWWVYLLVITQYLVSINFHVHIRAIPDKWDYVSKTLFTIFKGSLRRRIPQWMRALSLYCPIYHIGVTPIYVLKLHLHFIDFWQHQKNNINRNFTLN